MNILLTTELVQKTEGFRVLNSFSDLMTLGNQESCVLLVLSIWEISKEYLLGSANYRFGSPGNFHLGRTQIPWNVNRFGIQSERLLILSLGGRVVSPNLCKYYWLGQ
jgi:hypothetical protein